MHRKEDNYEHKDILDLRYTAKPFIGDNHIPGFPVAKHDKRRKHNRHGYSDRIEYFFPSVSLAC